MRPNCARCRIPLKTGQISRPEPPEIYERPDTAPRAILERLIADGKRVCRVITPYREHLAQHFAVTYMRIGLPAPYDTAP
jgi:hypothetical protein